MNTTIYTYPLTKTTIRKSASSSGKDSTAGTPLNFRPVTPESMKEIFPFLLSETGRTCDFSYGGVLMWVKYYSYSYCIYRNTLFIKGLVEGDRSMPAFSMPIGEMPLSEAIELLRDYCDNCGERLVFSAVPEYALDDFKKHNPLRIGKLEDMGDYLYSAESLSTLKGKKMSKKRNHVNKFESLYPNAVYIRMTREDVSAVLEFMNIIDAEGDRSEAATDERNLTRDLIADWAQSDVSSPLIGGMIKIDGEIVAFTMGDIKRDTLFVHIEKALKNIEGSYEAINKYFAADVKQSYPEIEYINREDDAGDMGLRMAKESYKPLEILQKYNIMF